MVPGFPYCRSPVSGRISVHTGEPHGWVIGNREIGRRGGVVSPALLPVECRAADQEIPDAIHQTVAIGNTPGRVDHAWVVCSGREFKYHHQIVLLVRLHRGVISRAMVGPAAAHETVLLAYLGGANGALVVVRHRMHVEPDGACGTTGYSGFERPKQLTGVILHLPGNALIARVNAAGAT